jgi:hypothetical protein
MYAENEKLPENKQFKAPWTKLPMAPTGAQKAAEGLERHLENPAENILDEKKPIKKGVKQMSPKELADREVETVKAWIKTMAIDVGQGDEMEVRAKLCEQIKTHMKILYFEDGATSEDDAASEGVSQDDEAKAPRRSERLRNKRQKVS